MAPYKNKFFEFQPPMPLREDSAWLQSPLRWHAFREGPSPATSASSIHGTHLRREWHGDSVPHVRTEKLYHSHQWIKI